MHVGQGQCWLMITVWPIYCTFFTTSVSKTLFGCGFKKAIETRRGEKLDVTPVLPKAMKLNNKTFLCAYMQGTIHCKEISRPACELRALVNSRAR